MFRVFASSMLLCFFSDIVEMMRRCCVLCLLSPLVYIANAFTYIYFSFIISNNKANVFSGRHSASFISRFILISLFLIPITIFLSFIIYFYVERHELAFILFSLYQSSSLALYLLLRMKTSRKARIRAIRVNSN